VKVPVSWLIEHLDFASGTPPLSAQEIADAFVRVGLEVEEITELGDVTGPLVVGRVMEIETMNEFFNQVPISVP
jgi:phenylalanyl-tRNA synthetase beta chain